MADKSIATGDPATVQAVNAFLTRMTGRYPVTVILLMPIIDQNQGFPMYTVYRLNADELSAEFLESLKMLFRHKMIEIAVTETDMSGEDETAYLLGNPANRARLLEAVENVRRKNLLDLAGQVP